MVGVLRCLAVHDRLLETHSRGQSMSPRPGDSTARRRAALHVMSALHRCLWMPASKSDGCLHANSACLHVHRYVEEEDLLALALGGRFVHHPAPLLCQEQPASA